MASPFLMRRREGQGKAPVFNHRTFERKLTWPLCLCPSLIHILNLSEVTALQKWHLKLRSGMVCRVAGSSWDRIPPLILHAASVMQPCPSFCLSLLSRAPGPSWSLADLGWGGAQVPSCPAVGHGDGRACGTSTLVWGKACGNPERFLTKMWVQRHSPLIGSPEHQLFVSEAWHESPGDLVKNPELLLSQ